MSLSALSFDVAERKLLDTEHNTNATKRKQAVEMAMKGNLYAMNGEHLKAVSKYTDALALAPDEYSFYVNRTLCYIKMDYFYLALYDINRAIELAPRNCKCYFIRGKILKKLNEYELAESDLYTAARIDPLCEEIAEEIARSKESGKENSILKNKLSAYDLRDKSCYKIEINSHLIKASNLPTNMWNYNGVRVENIHPRVPLDVLHRYFSLFGDVLDAKRIHTRVNNTLVFFNNPVTPMFTIAYFQDRINEELCVKERSLFKPLKLYFAPTDDQNDLKFSRPKYPLLNSQECYYWRTTSCNFNTRCPKLHIPVNKNIDTQIWMKEKN